MLLSTGYYYVPLKTVGLFSVIMLLADQLGLFKVCFKAFFELLGSSFYSRDLTQLLLCDHQLFWVYKCLVTLCSALQWYTSCMHSLVISKDPRKLHYRFLELLFWVALSFLKLCHATSRHLSLPPILQSPSSQLSMTTSLSLGSPSWHLLSRNCFQAKSGKIIELISFFISLKDHSLMVSVIWCL